MSTRAEKLAADFEKASAGLVAAIESSTDAQWQAGCANGEWTQAYAAYHAAESMRGIAAMLQRLADGLPPPSTTATSWDEINAMNAAQAKEHAACTKQDALDIIRRDTPGAAAMTRALIDLQLDRRNPPMMQGMPELTVEQFAEFVLIGHLSEHTESMISVR